MSQLLVSSDRVIYLRDLTDVLAGSAVTDATVSASIIEVATGTEVATATLSHIGGGTYRGIVPGSVALTAGKLYHVRITATRGTAQHTCQLTLPAVYDT